jgi:hypothetical protein
MFPSDVTYDPGKLEEIFSMIEGPCFVGHSHIPFWIKCIGYEETMSAQGATTRCDPLAENGEIVRQIVQAIQGIRHGQVQIIIQDSRVVQIDKTEKLRLA